MDRGGTVTDHDWHSWRGKGIGGSDIGALLGLSRFSSPTRLWAEKTGRLAPTEETQRLRIGKRMEPVLAAEFHDMTGLHVVGEQTWCSHPINEFQRCTVDGFVAENPDATFPDQYLGTVQFKTDGRHGWPDGIPDYIRAQCVWEMGVTGMQHCWLVVMFAGFKVEMFEIPWDMDAQSDWDFMSLKATEFWNEYVIPDVHPPMDELEATTLALGEMFPRAMSDEPVDAMVASEQAVALVAEIHAIKARIKTDEEREAVLSNELRLLLGECTDLLGIDGTVLATWRPQERRSIRADALREAHPAIADEFTTITTSRVLRVPTPKQKKESK